MEKTFGSHWLFNMERVPLLPLLISDYATGPEKKSPSEL